MIIAVDFDGVINACEYPKVGVLVAETIKGMQWLKDQGHTLIIWTCREGDDLLQAINFMLERGVPFDGVNCNARSNIEKHSNDSRKVYADLYIDDRNLGGFPGWSEVIRILETEQKQQLAAGYAHSYLG
ncbi:MAG: hypothetical protein PUK66_07175 [Bacteroidales bacterium]|uniref:hypothetical protein n=1 Tax=Porphyromonas sp. TaxID=1924944 RepID=UPI002974BCDC|nr:hypothetical protein [Porphyromonas sp.]MDD7438593.1 hypothetical protein [Bacteroidales bacterium]MDY3067849.1 hypothetical protein [Porphyromonas sp.]